MRLQTSHMSPTMDLDSISCLMIDPMMISRSFVQIITYLIESIKKTTKLKKALNRPKVEELETLVAGEVPPIGSVQK